MVVSEFDSERDAGWRAEPSARVATGRRWQRGSYRRIRPEFDLGQSIPQHKSKSHLAAGRCLAGGAAHLAAGSDSNTDRDQSGKPSGQAR